MSEIDGRHPIRRFQVALQAVLVVTAVFLHGCTGGEETVPSKSPSAVPTIERIEGMKYYVGGPALKFDKYGRMRVGGFNGEISSPTSRGLLAGFKKNPDSTFDYRTWLNGAILSKATGFLDSEGMLWYTERTEYGPNGDIRGRDKYEYDDEKQIMKVRWEVLDPKTGEVVTSKTQEMPYAPSEAEKQALEDDPEDEPAPAD